MFLIISLPILLFSISIIVTFLSVTSCAQADASTPIDKTPFLKKRG